MKCWVIGETVPLLSFLAGELAISKKKAKAIIDTRLVFVNKRRTWIASHRLKEGDIVEYAGNIAAEADITVIYQDGYVMAVNKPSGILSDNGQASLETFLRKKYENNNVKAIHRLDRETSGVILYARDNDIFRKFKEMWKDKGVRKIYLAICYNEAPFRYMTVERDIDGRRAVSVIELIKKNNGFSYFRIEPVTGKKHQIRIHLAGINFPVAGDKEYGIKKIIIG
jgi:23S rRNA pseudouridine1911/1915/1917 synthase